MTNTVLMVQKPAMNLTRSLWTHYPHLLTQNSKFTKPLTRFAYRNPLGVTAPHCERPIAAKLVDIVSH
mgnify:CR=1 FL=1